MAYIYIVFSSTPYKIGKLIRRFTGEAYNHVSISLDRKLTQMYSFARRHYRTPLYGGFVKESFDRYRVKGQPTQIQVCQVSITDEAYTALQARLEDMHKNRLRYLYNHLSVFTTPFRRWVKCKDAYICAEFVAEALAQAGGPVESGRYQTVGELLETLSHLTVYQGPMPPPTEEDRAYYAPHPVPSPLWVTLRDFFALFGRL